MAQETAVAVGVQSALVSEPSAILYLEAENLQSAGPRIAALREKVQPNEQRGTLALPQCPIDNACTHGSVLGARIRW